MGESTRCQALVVSQVIGVFCNNPLNRRGFSRTFGGRANTPAAKEVHEPPECSSASLPYSQSVREAAKKLSDIVIGRRTQREPRGMQARR